MPVRIRPFDLADPVTIRQRRLPHWTQEGCAYFITCHLGDSIPAPILQHWSEARRNWLRLHPPFWTDAEALEYHQRFTEEMERHLDAGRGGCALCRPDCAQAVVDTLLHGNGTQYDLGTFVAMPNHVHLLVVPRPGVDVLALVAAWRRISAHRINRLLGSRGALWADDAYDHIVRNQGELGRIDEYIRQNPAKAGLTVGRSALGGSIDGWEFEPSSGLCSRDEHDGTSVPW